MLTSGGHEVSHPNGKLLRHILTDFLVSPQGKFVISFHLFEYQRDVLENGTDPLVGQLHEMLENDPFVRLKSGLGRVQPIGLDGFEEKGMNLALFVFSELLKEVNAFFEDQVKQDDLSGDRENPFMTVVQTAYAALLPEEKSAVSFLTREHESGCVVECSRSPRPVFLKQPGFEEEFYIRVGPASAAMAVSEALKYIADHFPNA